MSISPDFQDHSISDKEVADAIRGAFDRDFYLLQYSDVAASGIDPLTHFITWGWRELRDPSPTFSTQHYMSGNPDVRQSGVNPLWHYVIAGRDEGRSSLPAQNTAQLPEPQIDETSGMRAQIAPFFDREFYLSTYPDIAQAGMDPLRHYMEHGWKEGRDPAPDFSTEAYLSRYPDVRESGLDPFWHYLTFGKPEGRIAAPPMPPRGAVVAQPAPPPTAPEVAAVPAPPPPAAPPRRISPAVDDSRLAREIADMKDAFDVDFYLGRYPDIALSQIDPLWHFAQAGWHEGRDPSPAFSVKYYLEANPDVQAQNLNPFWHYVVSGKAEGRLARHPGGYRADLLRRTLPLKDRSIEWRTSAPPETVMSAADVIEVLRSATWSETVGLMISIAHDNYRASAGGVQFCIQHEEQTARSRGVLYLNLYPLQPLPCLADMDETPDVLVSLLLSGVPIGVAPMSAVIAAVRARAGGFRTTEVVVHHLLGHSPEQVADLVRAAGGTQCWLWLHDFFTLCPSYALQRNDVSFCGAPPPGSNACRMCLYGPERDRHRARMARFFDGLSVQVIAPSRFAADFWQDRADLTPASITVKDHMSVERRPRAQWTPDRNEPISVAFIGYPAPHKGWSVFEKLVRDTGGSNAGFRFLYFGISEIGLSGVDRISVRVTAEDPDAMTRAIAAQSVDLVLHWASWPETFSFSTHEAMAAGAFVLTNTISGNVAATVQNLEMGVVLKDEAELLSFFRDGRVRQLAERVRRIRRIQEITLRRSDMTFSVLDEVRGT